MRELMVGDGTPLIGEHGHHRQRFAVYTLVVLRVQNSVADHLTVFTLTDDHIIVSQFAVIGPRRFLEVHIQRVRFSIG